MALSDFEQQSGYEMPSEPQEFLEWLRTEKDTKKVFYFIARKQATYVSEIADTLLLSSEKVKAIISQLKQRGFIERIRPSWHLPDRRLLLRKNDMWDKGIYGIERWAQIGWVGLAGIWNIILRNDEPIYKPQEVQE